MTRADCARLGASPCLTLSAVLGLALGTGCLGQRQPPVGTLTSATPDTGPVSRDVLLTLHGSGLLPRVETKLGGKMRTRGGFAVRLEPTTSGGASIALTDVMSSGGTQVVGTIPAGGTPGSYDIVLVDPYGREVPSPSALIYVACADANDDGECDSGASGTAPVVAVTSSNPADLGATAGLTVEVTATWSDVDGDLASVTWDWGDASTSAEDLGTYPSGDSPSHTYGAPGAYTITLTGTDATGRSSEQSLTVMVGGCSIGGSFYAAGTFDATTCQRCEPLTSTSAWTAVPDGATCGAGQYCNGGACCAPAASFEVAGFPSTVAAGTTGTFTVTALDASANVLTCYVGTVQFSSSDSAAVLPADYTFAATDLGSRSFDATLVTPTAPATHVQNVVAASAGTVLSVTFPNAVNAGDLLVGDFRATTSASVSDSINGSWTLAAPSSGLHYLFYLENSQAAAANTLTVTLTAGGPPTRMQVDDFSGVATVDALDGVSMATSTGTTWSAGTTSFVPYGELVWAGAGVGTSGLTFAAGATHGVPMTLTGQINTDGSAFSEYAACSAAGPQDSTVSVDASATVEGGQLTFRSGNTTTITAVDSLAPSLAGQQTDIMVTSGVTLIQQTTASTTFGWIVHADLPRATTVGALLVMIGAFPSGMISRVSGGGVTTWSMAAASYINANEEIWYGVVSTPSTTGVSVQGPLGRGWANVTEWVGLVGTQAQVLDQAAAASGSTSPASAGPITTVHANDLIFFGAAAWNPNTFGTPSGGPWTAMTPVASGTSYEQVSYYQIAPSTATYNPTLSATSTGWDAAVAAFKVAP